MPRSRTHSPAHAATCTTLAIAATSALLTAAPGAHAASIWTPLASGTTETITAVSHRPDKTVFGTANGKIFSLPGGLRASFPGEAIVDLELNPSGSAAVAVLDSGKAVRSPDGGATWNAPVQLQTYNFAGCQNAPGAAVGLVNLPSAPTAVRWSSDYGAYITSNVSGSILRTANAGGSWSEISRQANRTCVLRTTSPLTDVAPIVGTSSVYFIGQSFGNTWFSSDAVASTPSDRDGAVNCFTQKPSLAVDSSDGTRLAAGDGCNGSLNLRYSEDGGTSYETPERQPSTAAVNGVLDVDFVGGTIVWAGKAGDLFTSRTGRTAYAQQVEGPDATRDWRSVSGYSADHFAIGGTGGALYVTASASTIPDVIAPSGSIVSPGTVTAGVPVQLTANLVDNDSGSGIDPSSIRWTATGIPEASGNPATIIFPAPGPVNLRVSFKDNAGNAAEATRTITVAAPSTGSSAAPLGSRSNPIPAVTKRSGAFTVGAPESCVAAGASFTTSMALRRKVVVRGKVATLRRVDFFINGKRVKIDRKAPFRQVLTASGKPGARLTFRAVGYLRASGKGAPVVRRSATSKIAVCK